MKKIAITTLILSFFWSCDVIDDPIKEVGASCGDCQEDPMEEYISTQNVIIEEFTGITCNNCPTATAEAQRLVAQYPGRVFVLGVHAGNFAIPDPSKGYVADFRTEVGTEIYNFAQPLGVPTAMINRVDYNSSGFTKFHQTWETEVQDIIQRNTAPLAMAASYTFNEDSTEMCMELKLKSLQDLSGRDIYWTAYVSENNIVAAQKQPDNSQDPNYVHNHVLRAAFTSHTGEPLSALNFNGVPDEKACISRTLNVKTDWKAEDLHVLAYLFDNDTKEILQVVEAH